MSRERWEQIYREQALESGGLHIGGLAIGGARKKKVKKHCTTVRPGCKTGKPRCATYKDGKKTAKTRKPAHYKTKSKKCKGGEFEDDDKYLEHYPDPFDPSENQYDETPCESQYLALVKCIRDEDKIYRRQKKESLEDAKKHRDTYESESHTGGRMLGGKYCLEYKYLPSGKKKCKYFDDRNVKPKGFIAAVDYGKKRKCIERYPSVKGVPDKGRCKKYSKSASMNPWIQYVREASRELGVSYSEFLKGYDKYNTGHVKAYETWKRKHGY